MASTFAEGTQPGTERNSPAHAVEPRHCEPINPKPCSKRMPGGGWCIAVDGHEGCHMAVPSSGELRAAVDRFGPAYIAEANARRAGR